MTQTFSEWVAIREGTDKKTLWERHKELPSLFTSTHYALPTSEQLDEFEQYSDLTAEDIYQGVGYTIVGRGVSSPDNCQKIIESIKMLVERYPDREAYKEALTKAKEEAKIKLEKWQRGVKFP